MRISCDQGDVAFFSTQVLMSRMKRIIVFLDSHGVESVITADSVEGFVSHAMRGSSLIMAEWK
jgi:hypothetical protein